MPLQKNVKSRVFWIFQKNVKTYSRTMGSATSAAPIQRFSRFGNRWRPAGLFGAGVLALDVMALFLLSLRRFSLHCSVLPVIGVGAHGQL